MSEDSFAKIDVELELARQQRLALQEEKFAFMDRAAIQIFAAMIPSVLSESRMTRRESRMTQLVIADALEAWKFASLLWGNRPKTEGDE